MSTRENLTHGPGTVAVAPLGTALPATAADAAAIEAGTFPGFVTVGQTSSPVTFAPNHEWADTRSSQALLPLAKHHTGSAPSISAQILELTYARIAESLNGTVSGSGATVQFDPAGTPGQATYYAVAIVGPHMVNRKILWVAEVAAPAGEPSFAYGREEDTTLDAAWNVVEGTPEGLGKKGYRGYSFAADAVKLPAQVVGSGVETAALDFSGEGDDTSFTVKVGAADAVTITLDADLTDADALAGVLTAALTGEAVTVTVTTGNVVTITSTNTTDSIVIGGDSVAVGITAGTYAPTTVS